MKPVRRSGRSARISRYLDGRIRPNSPPEAFGYADSHVETVKEYIARGGRVTRARAGWSQHLFQEQTFLSILNGGTVDDVERGFAWADFPAALRETIHAAVGDTVLEGGQ